jgi:uncharacterized protein YabN with tetrapyrrole methylase and pyrophosphatase domain
LGEKASRVGFDWPDLSSVFEKLEEELKELQREVQQNDVEKMKEEMGDLLFSLAQISRFMKINPEESLRHASEKFIRRFQEVERTLSKKNRAWDQAGASELDQLWKEAKKKFP